MYGIVGGPVSWSPEFGPKGKPPLIENIAVGALPGDKTFDGDWLRAELEARGAAAVIPPRASRKGCFRCDRHLYRWRHLIENYFAKLKEFRSGSALIDFASTVAPLERSPLAEESRAGTIRSFCRCVGRCA